ncbi:MAG: hypothetical protein IJX98_06110 [Clostridia bacterium]|nr:hypothetical protein [Clostridia bacterium]
MNTVKVDFSKTVGKMKPMHAVNNGPVGGGVRAIKGNFQLYQDLKIPYARLHDASFFSSYGGEWSVDVHRIFCDFDADENDPASYDFVPTDGYLQRIQAAGTQVFYRLGASIEHGKKKGTFPPKDYAKWARICEHIILHYNEGWANGFHMGIKYWEIWNEPDCKNADGSNPCWQGTEEEFFEFFKTAAKYLKGKFPDLKIGGPAVCFLGSGFADRFLPYCRAYGVPLDFFSYHCYTNRLEKFSYIVDEFKQKLTENGYGKAETILNEWNYVRGWLGEEMEYSFASEKGLKGSSFVAGAMAIGQARELDMLMYYDARPSGMNGIWATETYRPLKTYFVLKAFSELYEMGTNVQSQATDGLYAVAATDGKTSGVLITYYDEDDSKAAKEVKVCIQNAVNGDRVKAEYFLVDENNDLKLLREEIFTANEFAAYLPMTLHSTYYIRLS